MANSDIDSTRIYRPLWLCFRLLSPSFFGGRSMVVKAFVLLLHLLVTCLFPLHLLLGLLQQPEPEELFKNFTVSITVTACSLKHLFMLHRLPLMVEIEALLVRLDKRVESAEERRYFKDELLASGRTVARCFYASFAVIYIIFIMTVVLLLIGDERQLLYTGWLPFDWRRNGWLHALAFGYQCLGMFMPCGQALTNDVYPPLTLCILAGHIRLLALRVARLGHNQLDTQPESQLETQPHRQQLLSCIEDHKLLMRLHQLTQQTISQVQLVQLASCGGNLCIVIFYVLFFVQDIISIAYYAVYLSVICIQLFPSCYYASILVDESERLPYAIFSSNWNGQSAQHRRDVLIFTQLTVRTMTIKAGGIVMLDLNAFFATIKMAYSLFAVVARFK